MKIPRKLHRLYAIVVRGLNGMARSDRTSGATRFAKGRIYRSLRTGEEGNALVEFTLVLPILIMVVLGIYIVGIAYNNQTVLTNAVNIGGNYLSTLTPSNTTDPCADTFTQIKNAAGILTPGSIKVSFSLEGTSVPAAYNPSCGGDQSLLSSKANVTVTATYPCNLVIEGINFAPSGCNLYATITELGN